MGEPTSEQQGAVIDGDEPEELETKEDEESENGSATNNNEEQSAFEDDGVKEEDDDDKDVMNEEETPVEKQVEDDETDKEEEEEEDQDVENGSSSEENSDNLDDDNDGNDETPFIDDTEGGNEKDVVTLSEEEESEDNNKKGTPVWLWPVVAVVGCLTVCLAIILPIVLLKKDDDSSNNNDIKQIITVNTSVVELPEYSIKAIQNSPASPQALAYLWMAADPNLDKYDQSRRLQRYAMATVFYAFRGENWTSAKDATNNWLSYDTEECFWFQQEPEEELDANAGIGTLIAASTSRVSNCWGDVPIVDDPVVDGASNQNVTTTAQSESNNQSTTTAPGTVTSESKRAAALGGFIKVDEDEEDGHGNIFDHRRRRRFLRSLQEEEQTTQAGSNRGPDWALHRLNLPGNGLLGRIPPELYLLSDLEMIDLSNNDIFGGDEQVPNLLSDMPRLEDINLSYNWLTGINVTDQIAFWTSLQRMNLSNNRFTTISDKLFDLPNLQVLDVGNNQLEGPLTGNNLASSTLLRTLRLHENDMKGSIPSEIGLLGKLENLELDGNVFTGSIPSEIGNLSLLKELMLYGNSLVGKIPSEIGSMTSLSILGLINNALTGPIPTTVGNLQNLTQLWLYGNALTGTLPEELVGLFDHGLTHLVLYWNDFTGVIPEKLCLDTVEFDCDNTTDNALCGCDCPCGGASGNSTVTANASDTSTANLPADDGTESNDASNTTTESTPAAEGTSTKVDISADSDSSTPDSSEEAKYGIRSVDYKWDESRVTLTYTVSDYIMDSAFRYVLYDGLGCRNNATDITGDANSYLFMQLQFPEDGGPDLNNQGIGSRVVDMEFEINKEGISSAPFYATNSLESASLDFCVGLVVDYNDQETEVRSCILYLYLAFWTLLSLDSLTLNDDLGSSFPRSMLWKLLFS